MISSFIVLFYSNLQNKQSGNEKDANGMLNIIKNIVKFGLLLVLILPTLYDNVIYLTW